MCGVVKESVNSFKTPPNQREFVLTKGERIPSLSQHMQGDELTVTCFKKMKEDSVNVNNVVAEAISTALNCSSTPHARQTALSFLHSVRNFSNSSSSLWRNLIHVADST